MQAVVRVRGPSLPYDPTYHLLGRVDKIRAIAKRERPSVLEAHSPYLALLGALVAPRGAFGARTFWWHADFIDTYLKTMLEKRARSGVVDTVLAPLWSGVRTMLSACDATFVASRWQADKLRAHGVPRVQMIPFGVETGVFTPRARSGATRRELLGAKAGAALLVAVGRFAVEKRWGVVLDAHERIAEALAPRGGAVLAVCGDGPERAAIEARVQRRDDVRLLGFLTDRGALARTLASADLMLHACPFETFGLGVAEAVACALPVVAPDEGGAAEVVDRSCGAVYPSGDAEACAAAAVRLLAQDRGELAARAAAAASRALSVDDHFTQVLSAYESLLDKRSWPSTSRSTTSPPASPPTST